VLNRQDAYTWSIDVSLRGCWQDYKYVTQDLDGIPEEMLDIRGVLKQFVPYISTSLPTTSSN
jgi:hypothetical protein